MEKKQKIILKAIELFATNGYHNTSTARIAKEAGTANGLIFHHFTNKEGLLKQVIGYLRTRVQEIIYLDPEKPPREALLELIDRLQAAKYERDFWQLYHALLFQPALTQTFVEKIKDIFDIYQINLERAFAQLQYPNPAQTALNFEAQRTGIILSYMVGDDLYPIDQMLQELGKYATESPKNLS